MDLDTGTANAIHADTVRLHIERIDTPAARHAELLAGLLQPEAQIAPKFFYDEQGSALYGAIVALDEYYPPRLEAAIFEGRREAIAAALPRAGRWVDLGCGDARKARPWLRTLDVRHYVGVDIAEAWLRASLQALVREHAGLHVEGVVTDFTRGLALQRVLQPALPTVFFYPGSSIGNFDAAQARALLGAVRAHLGPHDRLFIAVDGPKAAATLVAAYDDALGVTAAFNRNVLRVVNRALDADFDLGACSHRAVWNAAASRIEMHLVATRAQAVRLGPALRRFERGEAIVTEHSYKYGASRFAALLADAGFADAQHWSDDGDGYHVFVAAPTAPR